MNLFELIKLDWLRTKIRHEIRMRFVREYFRYRQRGFDHAHAKYMAGVVL